MAHRIAGHAFFAPGDLGAQAQLTRFFVSEPRDEKETVTRCSAPRPTAAAEGLGRQRGEECACASVSAFAA